MKRIIGIAFLIAIVILSITLPTAQAVKPGEKASVVFDVGLSGLNAITVCISVTEGLEIVNISSTQALDIGSVSTGSWQLNHNSMPGPTALTVEVLAKENAVNPQKVTMSQNSISNSGASAMGGYSQDIYIELKPITITGISLDHTTVTLDTGETKQITATVSPENATSKSLTWASSNTAFASVSANGLVIAVAPGTATITATTNDGSEVSASCDVIVSQPLVWKVNVITLDPAAATLETGKTQQLTATVFPENATEKSLTWSSSNTDVVTVNTNGLVTAVDPGMAVITAAANDGSGVSATCAVIVIQQVTGIMLEPTYATMEINTTQQLVSTVFPDNAADKSLAWASSKTAFATVDANGLVTAIALGTAIITSTANDGSGMSAACAITVMQNVIGTVLDSASSNLETGITQQMNVTLLPENAPDKSLTYASSANAVASMDTNGLTMAVAPGTANITTTALVTEEPVILIALDQTSVRIGETLTGSYAVSSGAIYNAILYYTMKDVFDNEITHRKYLAEESDTGGTFQIEVTDGVLGFIRITAAMKTDDYGYGFMPSGQTDWFAIQPSNQESPKPELMITLDKESVEVGGTITATYTLNNPLPEGAYMQTSIRGIAWGNTVRDENTNTISFYPRTSGAAYFLIRIFDNSDESVEFASFTSDWFTVTGEDLPPEVPTYPVLTVTPDKASVAVGTPVAFTMSTKNAELPITINSYTIFVYEGFQLQPLFRKEVANPEEPISFTPAFGTKGSIYVTCTDATNHQFSGGGDFMITGAASTEPVRYDAWLEPPVVDAGEPIAAEYTITGGRAPWTVQVGWNTKAPSLPATSENLVFTQTQAGLSYYASFSAVDMDGRQISFSSPWAYVRKAEEGFLPALNRSTFKVGETLIANWPEYTGDAGPYTYACSIQVGGWSTRKPVPKADLSFNVVPAAEGIGQFDIDVYDKDKAWVESRQLSFQVKGDLNPLFISLSVDPGTITVGETVTGAWNVTGGEAPYKARAVWNIYEGDQSSAYYQVSDAAPSIKLTPLFGDRGRMFVEVIDGIGRLSSSEVFFTITGSQPRTELACSIHIDKIRAAVGESVTAQWTVSGGIPPYTVEGGWAVFYADGDYGLLYRPLGDGIDSLKVPVGKAGQLDLYISDASGQERDFRSARFIIQGVYKEPDPNQPGDANDDGLIDIMDLVAIIDYIVYSSPLASEVNADANGDGSIDIMDLVWIIDYIVGN